MSVYLKDDDENEGLEVFCPYCGKPVVVPAGYNRPTYLCPRCHKAIPLDEKMRILNSAIFI